MKIQGPKSLNFEKLNSTPQKPEVSIKNQFRSKDQVTAEVSSSLHRIERALQESDVEFAEIHSHLNEERLRHLFDSLERLESKPPVLDEQAIMELADKTAAQMREQGPAAASVYNGISASRVSELLA